MSSDYGVQLQLGDISNLNVLDVFLYDLLCFFNLFFFNKLCQKYLKKMSLKNTTGHIVKLACLDKACW